MQNLGDNIFKKEGELVIDCFISDSYFFIVSPIAGLDEKSLKIDIENNILVIKGKREDPYKKKEKEYLKKECFWGDFSKRIPLPENLDINRTKASFKQGILEVKIPVVEKISQKEIPVDKD